MEALPTAPDVVDILAEKDREIAALKLQVEELEAELGENARITLKKLDLDDMMDTFRDMQEEHNRLMALEQHHFQMGRDFCQRHMQDLKNSMSKMQDDKKFYDKLAHAIRDIETITKDMQDAEVQLFGAGMPASEPEI